jgi:periplasmic protein TonB
MNAQTLPWLEDEDPRDLRRWAIAAALVLGVHLGGIGLYAYLHQPEEIIGDDTSPITIDLTPSDDTIDQPEIAPVPESQPKTVDQAPPPPDTSEAVMEPQEPPLQPIDQPEVAAFPESQPTSAEQAPSLPPDASQAVAEPQEPAPRPTPVQQPRPPSPAVPPRVKGGAPRIAPSWETALVRRLEQYKRYPSEARARRVEGVVTLNFRVNRNGHVLAHEVVRSSGHPELDNEVVSMIERAQPLPPFPPSMPQDQLNLTVPIRFSLR